MRKFIPTLAGILISSGFVSAQSDIDNRYPGYKLVFQDEFDKGDKPDTEVWQYEHGLCRNHEDQYYQEYNATVRDGCLVIEARKERVKNEFYKRYSSDWKTKNQYAEYTSSSIWAKPDYQFQQGIYEVRAKIPVGAGYWPAIWSTGSKYEWPYNGEIDMMEYYGDAIHANVAWGGSNRWQAVWSSQAPKMSTFDADFADKFHIWRMEWTDEAIRIYLDDRLLNETKLDRTVNANPGQSWYNVDNYNPYRDPENKQRMWLNFALGGDNGGSLANTVLPAEYLVDYVRIYVPDGKAAELGLAITKAENLLEQSQEGDYPGCFSSDSRRFFEEAIEEAKTKLTSEDENEILSAIDALAQATASFNDSVNKVEDGVAYRLKHVASGCLLSTGWYNEKQQVLLLEDNSDGITNKDYNQEFTFVPNGNSYNLLTGDGNYVYRDSWNLFWTDSPTLTTNNYKFLPEYTDGYVVLKNLGSGKYFGSDDTTAWSCMYSDKAGSGNPKAWFRVYPADMATIEGITADNEGALSAVYSLQGMLVGTSQDDFDKLPRGIYIIVKGGKTFKIAK